MPATASSWRTCCCRTSAASWAWPAPSEMRQRDSSPSDSMAAWDSADRSSKRLPRPARPSISTISRTTIGRNCVSAPTSMPGSLSWRRCHRQRRAGTRSSERPPARSRAKRHRACRRCRRKSSALRWSGSDTRGSWGANRLLARLDQLLIADTVDRWVVVTGGPGMGKSAVLAAWPRAPRGGRRLGAASLHPSRLCKLG